jgi:hypothetical protein
MRDIMLNVVLTSFIFPNVALISVIQGAILSVILSVILISAIMLNVVLTSFILTKFVLMSVIVIVIL